MHLFSKSKQDEAEAESKTYLEAPEHERGWNSDSDCPPPAYDDDAPSYGAATTGGSSASGSHPGQFSPTAQLQIQAVGYTYCSALYGNNFEQIPIYRPDSGELEYTSLRLKKSSNSCALVRGANPGDPPVLATVYRWGPGRPPRMKILPKGSTATVEEAIKNDDVPCELVEVRSRNMFSRTQIIETTTLGATFEWRYGSRDERKAAFDAHSLLIMDMVESSSGGGGKMRTRVAQLVRNDEFRTPGTDKYMGGNGGRLMMDLSQWADGKSVSARDIEEFTVASCLCMLKREADRFQSNAVATVV